MNEQCYSCESGEGRLNPVDIRSKLEHMVGWTLSDSERKLIRCVVLSDFKEAMSLLNEIAEAAEYMGHHPDLHLKQYRKVLIELSTHKINGLTELDFVLASKIDDIVAKIKSKVEPFVL